MTQHPSLVRFAEGHGFRQADSCHVGSFGFTLGRREGKDLIIATGALRDRLEGGDAEVRMIRSIADQISSTWVRSGGSGCGAPLERQAAHLARAIGG